MGISHRRDQQLGGFLTKGHGIDHPIDLIFVYRFTGYKLHTHADQQEARSDLFHIFILTQTKEGHRPSVVIYLYAAKIDFLDFYLMDVSRV